MTSSAKPCRAGTLPSAFFSVSLAAHGDMENARAYVENFERETGWRPVHVGFFSGALLYRQYGFLKRLMMKKIVRDKPGNLSLDTSRDHEYTEWNEVKRLAEDFMERLVPKPFEDQELEAALSARNSRLGNRHATDFQWVCWW